MEPYIKLPQHTFCEKYESMFNKETYSLIVIENTLSVHKRMISFLNHNF